MYFPGKYNQTMIVAALKSRRGYLRNAIIKNIPACEDPCYHKKHTRGCVGCVFTTTDDELTEYLVRQNISMCTRRLCTKISLDCSPISKDDYEWSRQVALI